jgi:hypothetical protein
VRLARNNLDRAGRWVWAGSYFPIKGVGDVCRAFGITPFWPASTHNRRPSERRHGICAFTEVLLEQAKEMSGKFQMQMPGKADWTSYLEWSGRKCQAAHA